MTNRATKKPELSNDESTDESTIVARARDLEAPTFGHRASLVVLDGWEIGRELEVSGDAQVVGRSSGIAHIVIGAGSVSRQHARIDRVAEGGDEYHTITDLKSSNGTYVNNVQVTMTRLNNGDKVRMGDVVFKFMTQDATEARFHKHVHRLIHFNQLTGLLTMESFRDRLDMHLRDAVEGTRFTLAMTDLDGLKKVNDTHGHLAGRMTIETMGQIIRTNLRTNDVAGLYGGDEAIILYPHASMDEAREVAEVIRQAVEERLFEYNGATFHVSISQGLAEWPVHGRTAEELIASADRALYAAKEAGRNRVHCAPLPERA